MSAANEVISMMTALSDSIWWYDLSGTNAYLVDDGTLTLVDTGLPWHGNTLIGGLQEAGFDFADIDRILLTHFDVDHVGSLAAFDGNDLTVYVGAPDEPLVTGERAPPLSNHKGLIQRLGRALVTAPDNPVEAVSDGDTVGSFTVYETPGHTPGHVCYVSESLSAAFLGDLVREADGELQPSPWAISYDTSEIERSIKSFDASAPDFETAAMGHGVPFAQGGCQRLSELAAGL